MAKKVKKKEEQLDEFYYHEALDRSYIVANMIEDVLVEHPVIEKHKELKEKVQKAQELIIEVYQEIGGLSVKLFTDPSELPDFMRDNKV
jgi:hypothetical protein